MLALIIVSLLFALVMAAILIGIIMAWALSGSEQDEELAKTRKSGRWRSRLRRFWSWANAVPPRLEYRRDSKGRFRKLKRW